MKVFFHRALVVSALALVAGAAGAHAQTIISFGPLNRLSTPPEVRSQRQPMVLPADVSPLPVLVRPLTTPTGASSAAPATPEQRPVAPRGAPASAPVPAAPLRAVAAPDLPPPSAQTPVLAPPPIPAPAPFHRQTPSSGPGPGGTQPRFAAPAHPSPAAEPALATASRAAPQTFTPSAPQPTAQPAVASRSTPAAMTPFVTRHLPNNTQGYRLTGEIGVSEWPMFLTAAQARGRLRFRVGYLSAVSVMPEASTLTLSINDEPIGQTRISAANSVRAAEFDVPPGLLKPGFNAIRIGVEQRHRVDCSLQSTYELWTQIDPTQTGLIIPRGEAAVSNLTEIGGLMPDPQGALPMRVTLPSRTSAANIERVVRAVQLISLIGRFEQPTVDIGPLADGDFGLNLVVGLSADVLKMPGLDQIGVINGARVVVLPASNGRRTTVVITGTTEDEVNKALGQLAVAGEPKGALPGLRAASAFPGMRVDGAQRVRLRDIGVATQEFSGRFFRTGFNIIMPPDFYAADYAKAQLALDGGYAPGLTNQAEIVVNINGRNAVSYKLPKSAGDVFKQNEVPLPLGLMRPGLNRIEIEALVPNESDASCDPLGAIRARKRFLFLDTTELILPQIARIARMPDLAVTATGGFPYTAGTVQPKLYVPSPDRDTIGAAATLAARMAISAGRALDFRFTVNVPPKGSGSTLVVGALRTIDPSILKATGVDPEQLRDLWADVAAATSRAPDEIQTRFEARARYRQALQNNFPATCRARKPPIRTARAAPVAESADARAAAAATPTIDTGVSKRDLFDEWQTDVRGTSWRARIGAALSSLGARAQTAASTARVWAERRTRDNPEEAMLTERSSLLVAQNILGETSDDVWTVVTAPNASILEESVACLVDPRVWRQLEGRASALDPSEGALRSKAADNPRFIETQPLSVGNLRLIAASWLSTNRYFYLGFSVFIALCLGAATTWFVRNVGRKPE